jgi:hypothetical protein
MSSFIKLLILSKDIEILEEFGDYKSANILHKKFIREAQNLEPTRKTGPYKQVFDKYLANAQNSPSQSLINQIRGNGFLFKEDQDQLISLITSKMNAATLTPTTNATLPVTTSSANKTPNTQGAEDYAGQSTAYQIATPKVSPVATSTATPQAVSQTPLVSIPVNNQQQSAPQTLSDTANYNAAMEPFYSGASQASLQQNLMQNQKVNEQQLYMDSLNEIIELFKTKRPEAINAAEQIYVNTYTQLTNQSSKKLFAQQIQRLRNQYNTARLKGQR